MIKATPKPPSISLGGFLAAVGALALLSVAPTPGNALEGGTRCGREASIKGWRKLCFKAPYKQAESEGCTLDETGTTEGCYTYVEIRDQPTASLSA